MTTPAIVMPVHHISHLRPVSFPSMARRQHRYRNLRRTIPGPAEQSFVSCPGCTCSVALTQLRPEVACQISPYLSSQSAPPASFGMSFVATMFGQLLRVLAVKFRPLPEARLAVRLDGLHLADMTSRTPHSMQLSGWMTSLFSPS